VRPATAGHTIRRSTARFWPKPTNSFRRRTTHNPIFLSYLYRRARPPFSEIRKYYLVLGAWAIRDQKRCKGDCLPDLAPRATKSKRASREGGWMRHAATLQPCMPLCQQSKPWESTLNPWGSWTLVSACSAELRTSPRLSKRNSFKPYFDHPFSGASRHHQGVYRTRSPYVLS